MIGSYPSGFDEPCVTVAILALEDNEESIQGVLRRIDDSHPDGAVLRSFCEDTSFSKQFEYKTEAYPEGHRYCADNSFLNNEADVVSLLEPAFTTLPTKKSLALYNSMVPTSRRKLPPMAFSIQSDHYFALYGIWEAEEYDGQCQTWVSNVMENIGHHSVGAYTGEFDFQARKSRFWGDEERRQLRAVRQKWDPEGVFCDYLGLEE